MKKLLATTLIVAMGASISMADALAPILADGNDQVAYGDGTGKWFGQSENRIGKESTARYNAFIIPFALPTLSAGESISSASISLNVKSQSGPYGGDTAWNIDVYGVRASNSSVVDLNNDGFIGANDAGATKVDDNFFVVDPVSSVALGVHSSSAAGETALGAWLQTLYTGSVPNQTYAFLRFNSDDAAMVFGRYLTVYSGNATSNQPALTITTIPEPATLGLVGAVAGAMLFIRRKFMI